MRYWLLIAGLAACTGGLDATGSPTPSGPDAGAGGPADANQPPPGELDRQRAQERFVTTTDLMRRLIAPGCAAETNECHSNEDFPDMSSEGNLWNLIDLRCNLGVGERLTVEDFCESLGDELRLADGFTSRIGRVELVTDDVGDFSHYLINVADALPQTVTASGFEIVRDGVAMPGLGGGSSLEGEAGSRDVRVTDPGDIPAPDSVRQGDENGNQIFGDGSGVIVRAGDAANSYLVRRLAGVETTRIRMPLNENADNPTEANGLLTRDEMYAVMSWINCMAEGDGPYSPIRYDCAANANNDGTLQ